MPVPWYFCSAGSGPVAPPPLPLQVQLHRVSWGEFGTQCAHYAPGDGGGGWALPQQRHGRGRGVGASVQDPGAGRVSRALEMAGGPKSVGSRPAPHPGFGEGGRGATLGSALSSPSSDPQPDLTPAP